MAENEEVEAEATEPEVNPATLSDEELDKAGAEEAAAEAPEETPKTDETPSTEEETVTLSKAELEKLQKQVNDKEEYARKLQGERDRLAFKERQLQELLAKQTPDSLTEKVLTNPVEALEEMYQRKALESEVMSLRIAQEQIRNEAVVKQTIGDIADIKDDIANLALKQGFPPEAVADFKNNPWGSDPGIVVALAKEVRHEKRITALEAEIAKERQSKGEVVKKIAEAAKRGPLVTAASGQSTSRAREIDRSQLARMSEAELDVLLNESED